MHVAEMLEWQESSIPSDLASRLGTRQPLAYTDIVGSPLVDSTGVPFRSDRAPDELIKDIDFQYKPCPYKDSPSRFPNGVPNEVPMSGLEQQRLRHYYSDVLGFVALLRQMTTQGQALTGPLGFTESALLLSMIKFAPVYGVFRAKDPIPPNDIPPLLVMASNSAAGGVAAVHAILNHAPDRKQALSSAPSADEAIAVSERLGTMIGPKTVCAASPRMMQGFLSVAIEGVSHEVSAEVRELTKFLLPNLGACERLSEFTTSMHGIDIHLMSLQARDARADLRDRQLRSSMAGAKRSNARTRGSKLQQYRQERQKLQNGYERDSRILTEDIRRDIAIINQSLGRKTTPEPDVEAMISRLPLPYRDKLNAQA